MIANELTKQGSAHMCVLLPLKLSQVRGESPFIVARSLSFAFLHLVLVWILLSGEGSSFLHE